MGNALARDHHLFVDGADSELYVDPGLLRYVQLDILRLVPLKTLGGDKQVVGVTRQAGNDVSAVAICDGGTSHAARGVLDHDVSASDSCASLIRNGAADISRILSA